MQTSELNELNEPHGTRFIDGLPALDAWLARVSAAPRVALDIEGDGMFCYRGRICTIQLAAAGEVAILDTLAFDALPRLRGLLGAGGPEKIVHDASFDARMLHSQGIVLEAVFDTAVAARFLGCTSTGLSSLLAARFQLTLEKSHQQADWGARPLTNEMLAYLENDVRYLEDLYLNLLDEVRRHDIEAEVREESAYVLAQAAIVAPYASPWLRIKGAGQLLPAQRALLRELAEAREEVACKLDAPPGRIVSNEALLRLVLRSDLTEASVSARLGPRASPYEEHFVEGMRRARGLCDAPQSEVAVLCPEVPALSQIEAKKRRRRALMDFRAREATARGVDVQVVMPGHCLSDLAELPTLDTARLHTIAGFGAFRVERYGAKLISELGPRW